MSSQVKQGPQNPAVFLDRDGTVIVDKHYLGDPDGVELEANAAIGLRRLVACGLRLVGVTNQSGIAKGFFDLHVVQSINERVDALLTVHGVAVEQWYICPHDSGEGCACRKPQPGLLLEAASERSINLSNAFVIGDKMSDLELADAVGARGILVRTGYGNTVSVEAKYRGYDVVDDLNQAASLILTLSGLSNE